MLVVCFDLIGTDEAFLPAPRTDFRTILRDINFHVRHVHTDKGCHHKPKANHEHRESEYHDTCDGRTDRDQFQHGENTAAHFGQDVLRHGDGVLDGLQHDLDFQYSFR